MQRGACGLPRACRIHKILRRSCDARARHANSEECGQARAEVTQGARHDPARACQKVRRLGARGVLVRARRGARHAPQRAACGLPDPRPVARGGKGRTRRVTRPACQLQGPRISSVAFALRLWQRTKGRLSNSRPERRPLRIDSRAFATKLATPCDVPRSKCTFCSISFMHMSAYLRILV